jgi:hypothetical protein
MTGTNCDLFTHKSVPVIFELPCTYAESKIYTSDTVLSLRRFLDTTELVRTNKFVN